jgi:hypothetical protein
MKGTDMKIFLFLMVMASLYCNPVVKNTLQLHPENPHYFLFNGRPTILIGSTEHYGAVLNSEFDFIAYLDEVQRSGQNLTRTFSGVYCEDPTAFGISRNTMAPATGKLIAPWARSNQPGYFNGGNKFDLDRWDGAYFARLKSFVQEAGKRGIVVEYVLFCTYYDDSMWNLSPMNIRNNINGVGDTPRDEILALKHDDLTRVQEAFVRKVVAELNFFDNVYYEICNEPYFVSVTPEFQRFVSKTIHETEAALPKKHLIAQNVANNSLAIENPDPNVDIINFHYAVSAAVDQNYHLNKALGDDETGFVGTADDAYRIEAWNFLVSGGGEFDHLDYSYTVGHEDGTFEFPATQPGGGGKALRAQFQIMRRFIESFDFWHMTPMQEKILGGIPNDMNARLLGEAGKSYIGYFYRKSDQAQNISLRWSGKIVADVSGDVTFFTTTDDGVRLWVDGKLLIDDWTGHAPLENSGTVFMTAGKAADFKMEYYQGAGGAAAALKWSAAGKAKSEIPDARYRLVDGAGLKLEYFDDINLGRLCAATTVNNVAFSGDLAAFFPQQAGNQLLKPVLSLPAGRYAVQWLNTLTGEITAAETIDHNGGEVILTAPIFNRDIALGIQTGGK